MAVATYNDMHGSLPPPFIADANGKPMHSWRVLLLPFLEQKQLYNKYDFSEPWNGPNNRKLASQIPHVYRCPCEPQTGTTTSYVVVTGNGTAFPTNGQLKYSDIGDGSAFTILIVEIANSDINWMEPRDLTFDQMDFEINSPGNMGISSGHKGGATVALADGSTSFLSNETPSSTIRSLLTANGREAAGHTTPHAPQSSLRESP